MANVVHAHDLLEILMGHESPVTKALLQAEVERNFGRDVRFANCREQHFSFDELMEFFISRGKIIVSGGGLVVDRGELCSHH